MKPKIFVDGQAGTTGLEIHERLSSRDDIEVLVIDPEKRKDVDERKKLINASDITFLCLPDEASKESVSLCDSDSTRFIDASTAFRTADGWDYGMAELSSEQRGKITTSKRVSNPGCHATGFNLPIAPLVGQGLISQDAQLTCCSLTGYSGGGKQMINSYREADANDISMQSPRLYALGLGHKHLPEMKKASGLDRAPIFLPMVGNYYRGMCVSIPLPRESLCREISAQQVHDILSDHYADECFVKVMPFGLDEGFDGNFLNAIACNNTNNLEIFVFGDSQQIVLISRFDNLGKGASGAAVQNMNIMLGIDETTGLI